MAIPSGFDLRRPDVAIGNPEDAPATNPDEPSSLISLLKAIMLNGRVGNEVKEAPADGKMYARQNGTWVPLPIGADAIADGFTYGRRNHAWVKTGSAFSWRFEYIYNSTAAAPPASTQVRMDSATQSAATKLWFNVSDADSLNQSNFLRQINVGMTIFLQDKANATRAQTYLATGPAVDLGTYFEVAVQFVSGLTAMTTAQRVVVAAYRGGGG